MNSKVKSLALALGLVTGSVSLNAYSKFNTDDIKLVKLVSENKEAANSSYMVINASNYISDFKISKGITCSKSTILAGESLICSSESSIKSATLVSYIYKTKELKKLDISNSSFEDGALENWQIVNSVELDSSDYKNKDKENVVELISVADSQIDSELSRDIEIDGSSIYKLDILAAINTDDNFITKYPYVEIKYLNEKKEEIKDYNSKKIVNNFVEDKGLKEYSLMLNANKDAKYIRVKAVAKNAILLLDNIKLSKVKKYRRLISFTKSSQGLSMLTSGMGALCSSSSSSGCSSSGCSSSGCSSCDAQLGDLVWNDTNKNGLQDYGERGIAGVRVTLYKDGSYRASTTTNSSGYYRFTGLCSSNHYRIKIDIPNGWHKTRYHVGYPSYATRDSNIETDSGWSGNIELDNGDRTMCFDFGLYKTFQENPRIDIEKSTNYQDADYSTGPAVAVGSTVTWRYVVKNTGNVTLNYITVYDDKEGIICSGFSLYPGYSKMCTKTGVAKVGQYSNEAIVTGRASNVTVSDRDPSHYHGINPRIDVEKSTNGQDADTGTGPVVAVGSTVTWKYVVKNTGNVKLTDVVVKDDKEGTICTVASLNPGESKTCSKTGTAKAGQYANLATATGKDTTGKTVSDKDPSHYYGGKPGIDVEKSTNGQDADTGTGPELQIGSTVTWKYIVKNTGNLRLNGITVKDNKEGTICSGFSLNPGQSRTCTKTGTVKKGNYANEATATGKDTTGKSVSDKDPSHYHGTYIGFESKIDLEKHTNDQDADVGTGPVVAVGSTVTWKYIVKNSGETPLSNIIVKDDKEGTISCPKASLNAGESMTCTKSGTAKAGQYENNSQVTAKDPDGKTLSDKDPSHYYGGKGGIDVEKSTNGQDADTGTGPVVNVGSTVTWKYVVKNIGNVKLTNVTVKDNKEGTISCPKSVLNAGESMTCTKSGTAKAGQYANEATATAKDTTGKSVSDKDPSHYYGKDPANASLGDYIWYDENENGIQDSNEKGIEKVKVHLYKDGQDTGKVVETDSNGKYLFTNLLPGNYQIKVDKPKNYPYFTLQNRGTNEAKDSDIDPNNGLSDSITLHDAEHYRDLDGGLVCGSCATIDIEKSTNGQDADTGTGPLVKVGSTVTWKYVVKNTGNSKLSNIVVNDNKEGTISCPKSVLNAGESMTCTKTGIAKAGQYENKATVTGKPPVGDQVTDNDPSHYYGKSTSCLGDYVWNDKNINGVQDAGESGVSGAKVELLDANSNPAKDIDGNPVAAQTTGNDGKYKFCNLDAGKYIVKVTPPSGYLVSPKDQGGNDSKDSDIDPSSKKTTVINLPSGTNDMKWDAGIYNAKPGIDVEKSTNGQDADTGTGPVVAVGSTVTWKYVVKNTGNIKLTNVAVKDDKEGAISCPKTSLNAGESMTCTKSGTAKAGQYANEATATAKDTTGKSVSDKDPSHYYGKVGACLGDYVWEDKNVNGIQDSGESGVAGAKVELTDASGNSVKDIYGNSVVVQTTGNDGKYKFCKLDAGKYIVKVTPPSGYVISPKDQTSDSKDSDIDAATKKTTVITLEDGDNDMTWDAGIYKSACIGNYVWLDYDGDGIQGTDSREEGIAGAVVTLMDANGNSVKDINGNNVAPQTTGADGKYQFCNLKPGSYKVKMLKDDPLYYVTYKDKGSSDAKDSDIDATTFTTPAVELESGDDYKDLDGGYFKCGSLIGVYSVIPMQGMSAYSVDNSVVDGVSVSIYDENGNLYTTTQTDRLGNFKVNNLLPGNYKVVFSAPEGTKLTTNKEMNISVKAGGIIRVETILAPSL